MLLLMLLIVLFFALSGLMAAVDAAVLSVSRPEIDEMIGNGLWGSRRLRTVKLQIARAVVVIVILTNTINVLGPIVVSQEAVRRYGPGSVGVVIAVLTVGSIVLSEIIPKALGTHYAPTISRLAAPAIVALQWALYPLVRLFQWLSELLAAGKRPIGTEEQIRALVTIGRRAGYIESDEGRMIHRAFVLNDRTAADIMTPLEQVAAIDATATVRQAADEVRRSAFSRYPMFGSSADDVRGIVMSRHILQALCDGRDDDPVTTIARSALTVEADRRCDEMLVLFRDRHRHLAVVRDGQRTLGVVALEDVLEELVGEIEDEKDVEGGRRG